ncbi:MAG: phosphoesterase [Thermoprotei archaeon]|nr:MAG: phosphoesterase [Thermoprotei archaeon]
MIFLRNAKALIFADSHLGFEEDMSSKGIFIPRAQLSKLLTMLEEALNNVMPEVLIIAGDVKHIFNRLGRIERLELEQLFAFIKKHDISRTILVRGNHDNFLKLIVKKYNIEVVDQLLIEDVLIVHGHKEIEYNSKEFKIVIMGHEHPSIVLRNSIGPLVKIPCFLLIPTIHGISLVVLPASGIYQSGTAVTLARESYLSPIIRNSAILEEAKPIALIEKEGPIELPSLKLITDLIIT